MDGSSIKQLLYIAIIPLSFPRLSTTTSKDVPIYQARMILMPAWMKEPCMLHAAPIPLHIVGKATWPDSRAMWLIMLLLLPQQNTSRLLYEALEDVRYNIINQSIIQSPFSPKIFISQRSYLTLLRSIPALSLVSPGPLVSRFPNHLIYHHYRLL